MIKFLPNQFHFLVDTTSNFYMLYCSFSMSTSQSYLHLWTQKATMHWYNLFVSTLWNCITLYLLGLRTLQFTNSSNHYCINGDRALRLGVRWSYSRKLQLVYIGRYLVFTLSCWFLAPVRFWLFSGRMKHESYQGVPYIHCAKLVAN